LNNPRVDPGKRAFIAGRTGSGKSTLGCYLLEHTVGHWIILNPKHTAAYKNLTDVQIVTKFRERDVARELMKNKFTLLNLSGSQASPGFMDDIIQWVHEDFKDIGVCADELYTLHNNGRPGDGLTGILTRGRELRQSFIGLTQRPAWVSRFLLSEADYLCEMDLVLEDDRERMFQASGQDAFLHRVRDYRFLWYDVTQDKLQLYSPVPTTPTTGR
jgi:energy-coupling factor transporter ATP-binding protein EcfA2